MKVKALATSNISTSPMNKISPSFSSIRQARPDDIIQLLRIQTDSLRNLCISYYSSIELEALIERNIRHFSLGGCRGEFILVAEVDDIIVGWSSLLNNRISGIYVHPQFVRQGIGSQLLCAIETKAIKSKFPILSVAASFTAQPFYQSHNYQVIGRSFLLAQKTLRIPYLNMNKYLLNS